MYQAFCAGFRFRFHSDFNFNSVFRTIEPVAIIKVELSTRHSAPNAESHSRVRVIAGQARNDAMGF